MCLCSSGTVVDAIEISDDHFSIMIDFFFQHETFSSQDVRIDNKDIEMIIELFHDLDDELLNMLGIRDIDLIRLALDAT